MRKIVRRAAAFCAVALSAIVLAGCGHTFSAAGPSPSQSDALQFEAVQSSGGLQHLSSPQSFGAGISDTTPAVVPGYIVTVLSVTGTPCFNCVNGKTLGTFGSGDPLPYVNSTLTKIAILFVYFDVSFKGSCNLSVTLTQGTKTLASGKGSFAPSPGGVETAQLGVTRASAWHGAATMTGKAACGTTTATSKGTVYFQ